MDLLKKIDLFTGDTNESLSEAKETPYQKFFKKKLEKYGVKSPEELSKSEKKKFFNEIKKEWIGKKE